MKGRFTIYGEDVGDGSEQGEVNERGYPNGVQINKNQFWVEPEVDKLR